MISLRDKILKESILSSTKSGATNIEERIKEWFISQGVNENDIRITNEHKVMVSSVIRRMFELKESIPDFIKIEKCGALKIKCEHHFENLPEDTRYMFLEDCLIENFTFLEGKKVERLYINNCDIKSLKGLPTCDRLYIGNNKQVFSKKELKKYTSTKPNYIYTLGEMYDFNSDWVMLGDNDIKYITEEFSDVLKQYQKYVPEIKSIHVSKRKESMAVYIRLDFLLPQDHPNGISDNSIYIDFRYNLDECSLECNGSGHLNLTDEDKKGKYQYYALKGFTAPYYDKGGKKFRKVRLDKFDLKTFIDKTKDWVKEVVDAALEDQGGEFKRK
jgi:hypothetical protein